MSCVLDQKGNHIDEAYVSTRSNQNCACLGKFLLVLNPRAIKQSKIYFFRIMFQDEQVMVSENKSERYQPAGRNQPIQIL